MNFQETGDAILSHFMRFKASDACVIAPYQKIEKVRAYLKGRLVERNIVVSNDNRMVFSTGGTLLFHPEMPIRHGRCITLAVVDDSMWQRETVDSISSATSDQVRVIRWKDK